jgi:hypothetical protein
MLRQSGLSDHGSKSVRQDFRPERVSRDMDHANLAVDHASVSPVARCPLTVQNETMGFDDLYEVTEGTL